MPATKCPSCDHAHRLPPRRNPEKYCILNDRDNHVDKRLLNHDGLPFDCPGCLAHACILRKPYGRSGKSWHLQCTECRRVYYWNEGKDPIPGKGEPCWEGR